MLVRLYPRLPGRARTVNAKSLGELCGTHPASDLSEMALDTQVAGAAGMVLDHLRYVG